MTKPQGYKEQGVIHRDTPYEVDERFPKGPQAGAGVLTVGRVVWTEKAIEASENNQTVMAFAEGVGVFSVDARSLRS